MFGPNITVKMMVKPKPLGLDKLQDKKMDQNIFVPNVVLRDTWSLD